MNVKTVPKTWEMYWITVNGKRLPNQYRFRRVEKLHCQLHGEYYGDAWIFQKRKLSNINLWGGMYRYSPNDIVIEEVLTQDIVNDI
jgi:hypothetical protein